MDGGWGRVAPSFEFAFACVVTSVAVQCCSGQAAVRSGRRAGSLEGASNLPVFDERCGFRRSRQRFT